MKRENQTLVLLYQPGTSLRKAILIGGQPGLLTSLDVILESDFSIVMGTSTNCIGFVRTLGKVTNIFLSRLNNVVLRRHNVVTLVLRIKNL